MMVPDNWAFQHVWNIPMEAMTATIDNALIKGYTVAWGGDVSEPSFSWKQRHRLRCPSHLGRGPDGRTG
jgi:bleomycin hydrolase